MYPQVLGLPSYGAMLLTAWAAVWWIARRQARTHGLPAWQIDWLMPLLILGTGVGSRTAGWLARTFISGSVNDRLLYGGLLVACGAAAVFARSFRIPLAKLGDAVAIGLPLGIALLRVGCFLAGCCWGDICESPLRLAPVDDSVWRRQVQTVPALSGDGWPTSVHFPVDSPAYQQHRTAGLLAHSAARSLPVHPVQLYEAIASLILFACLLVLRRWLRRPGDMFLLAMLGYSVIRFVSEWFRADNPTVLASLTLSQLISALIAIYCGWSWYVRTWPRRQTEVNQSTRPAPP